MLKPAQAAELLGVGRTKLYNLIRAGAIPFCRVGKSIRVPTAALCSWAAAATKDGCPSVHQQKLASAALQQTNEPSLKRRHEDGLVTRKRRASASAQQKNQSSTTS